MLKKSRERRRHRKEMAAERMRYISRQDEMIIDAYPLIRDAINLCRSAAAIPHHCDRCPVRNR